MEAASEGACNAGGLVVAILPNERKHPLSGYPNRFVDIPVYTGMGDARNAINAKTPDVIVVLDGGPGTLSEMALAVKSKTPVVCLCAPGSVFEFGSGLVRVKNVGEAITEVDRIFKSKEP